MSEVSSESHERAAHIRQQMRLVRDDVDADVRRIVTAAKSLTDWKYYVERYPRLCAGAAAAVGYWCVPRKVQVVRLDASGVRELAKDQRVVVDVAPNRQQVGTGSTIATALLAVAGRALMNGGLEVVRRQFQQFVAQRRGASDDGAASRNSSHD